MKRKGMKKSLAGFLSLATVAGTMMVGAPVSADEDLPVLTWYNNCSTQNDEAAVEERINELLAQNGIEAKLDLVFQAGLGDKLNMMVTAGEEFDITFVANWLFSYPTNARKGAFMDLTDLIQEYGQDILALFPESTIEGAKVDGTLYAVPNWQNGTVQYSYCIQTELVEKYGLDVESIKEPRDIEPFLQTIKDNEPDLFPFRGLSWVESAVIMDAGSVKLNDYSIVTAEGKAVPHYEYEAVKDIAQMASEWYEKGYIREDINSVTDDSADQLAGKYAVETCADLKPGVEALYRSMRGRDYTFIPLMKATDGYDSAMSAMTAISATSKHPELAMQIINLANTNPEFYNTLCYGVEGVHYTKNEDGSITKTEASANYNPNADWAFGCQFNAYPTDDMELDNYQKMLEYNQTCTPSVIGGFVYDGTATDAERAALSTIKSEYGSLFNGSVGTENFEATWEEYVGKMEAAGINSVIEDLQTQVDAYFAAKN